LREKVKGLLDPDKSKDFVENWRAGAIAAELAGDDAELERLWAIHVLDDLIKSEHESQLLEHGGPPAYARCFPPGTGLRVFTDGRVSRLNDRDHAVCIYRCAAERNGAR
jgi:hypothetical protein